jgi:redox-sensitive bicupin YhaK (pirin superfamily)
MKIVRAERFVEGGGFVVHRPFPVQGLSYFDPFLLIDEMGPVQYGPGEAVGAPDHPHRGFETVTYIIDGEMEHEDSHGHRGAIRSGDVQWMTAGAGVIHSEMPSQAIMRSGGRMHGFQIWINLPREKKMTQPRYQEYSSAELPVISRDGVCVRVIAGQYDDKRSPIETTVPTTMLHVKLDADARASVQIAPGSNAIVHTIDGIGSVGAQRLNKHDVALIPQAPQKLELRAVETGFEALVLAGVPLNEPVARYGPFVMNDVTELEQAFDDYRAGRFGEIART